MKLPIDSIRITGGTQPRQEINVGMVNEYAEAMEDGAAFPPVVVFHDGVDHWLADGFHRYHAALHLSMIEIDAEVKTGTRRDAVLYSVGANLTHGMRRTNADKRQAVMTLLDDEEWSKWSDREIAKRCGVGYTLVSSLRTSLSATGSEVRSLRPGRSENTPVNRSYTDKHGTVATMNVEKIGHRREIPEAERPIPPAEPPSSAMYFARLALVQLERIQPTDPGREKALREVASWIEAALASEEVACISR